MEISPPFSIAIHDQENGYVDDGSPDNAHEFLVSLGGIPIEVIFIAHGCFCWYYNKSRNQNRINKLGYKELNLFDNTRESLYIYDQF